MLLSKPNKNVILSVVEGSGCEPVRVVSEYNEQIDSPDPSLKKQGVLKMTRLHKHLLYILHLLAFTALFISSMVTAKDAYTIRLTGQVEPGLQAYIERVIEQAENNDGIVVLDIETPGGRVDAALAIKNALLDAKVPTIAYVNRNAISAGALIALSCKKIYMAPGGTIGAATPVIGDVTKKAPEKVVSALRSAFAGAAEARGRDPMIAKAMVDESIAIPDVSKKGQLLTLTTDEAQSLKFIDGSAESLEDALKKADINGKILEQKPALAEEIVRFITRGEIASLLMTIGFLALLLEFKGAGWGLAGVISIICYGLLFWGHHIAGLAGGEEIAFVVIGILLILLEVLVIPGVGIAGIGGTGLLLYGLVMMLVGETVTAPAVLDAMTLVSISVIASVILAVVLIRLLFGKSEGSKLVLNNSYFNKETPLVELDVKIGDTGKTTTMLRPAGIALINNQRLDVVTEGDLVDADQSIIVHKIEGNRIVVKSR